MKFFLYMVAITLVYCALRWFLERIIKRDTDKLYLQRRRETVAMIDGQAPVRERLHRQGKTWGHDENGDLQYSPTEQEVS